MMKKLALLSTVAALAVAAPAHAATYLFTLTGSYNATFELDSNPTPSQSLDGIFFQVANVPGFSDLPFGTADINFFNEQALGGLTIYDTFGTPVFMSSGQDDGMGGGEMVYDLPESAPTFKLGTYVLYSLFTSTPIATLVISEEPAGPDVPEPASWAMMVAGMGLLGAAMRRANKVQVAYATA